MHENAVHLAMIPGIEVGGHAALVKAQAPKVFHPNSLNDSQIKQARDEMVGEYGAECFIAHLRAIN